MKTEEYTLKQGILNLERGLVLVRENGVWGTGAMPYKDSLQKSLNEAFNSKDKEKFFKKPNLLKKIFGGTKFVALGNYDVNSHEADFKRFIDIRKETFKNQFITLSISDVVQDENHFDFKYTLTEDAKGAFACAGISPGKQMALKTN